MIWTTEESRFISIFSYPLDEERIERLISLGKKYEAEWISRPLDFYFTQKQDGGFVNKDENEEEVDYKNCERNIKGKE